MGAHLERKQIGYNIHGEMEMTNGTKWIQRTVRPIDP
jgi:hypothetical protein